MEKQFNLILTNRWKATILMLGIVICFVTMLVGALEIFQHVNWLGVVLLLTVLAGFVFLPEIIARKFSAEFVVVSIDDAGLTVQSSPAGIVRRIYFADIDAYFSDLNQDFNLLLQKGPKLVLHLNHNIHPQGLGPLWAMQQHFEWAAADYQRRYPTARPICKLGFFNRPLATFWLVVFAGLVGWLGWRAFQPMASEGAWGGFVLVGLGLVVYVLMWQQERQNKLR